MKFSTREDIESVGLLTQVVDYTITTVVRQVGYLLHYKSNVQILENLTKELLHAKERLQHDVEEELRRVGQKTEADVEEWLTKVNKITFDDKQTVVGRARILWLKWRDSIDESSFQIPHNPFKEMKELKVLDLSNLCIPSLPPSVQILTNLQTLCLDDCQLRDISIFGELRI